MKWTVDKKQLNIKWKKYLNHDQVRNRIYRHNKENSGITSFSENINNSEAIPGAEFAFRMGGDYEEKYYPIQPPTLSEAIKLLMRYYIYIRQVLTAK